MALFTIILLLSLLNLNAALDCLTDEFECTWKGEVLCTPNDWKCDNLDDCDPDASGVAFDEAGCSTTGDNNGGDNSGGDNTGGDNTGGAPINPNDPNQGGDNTGDQGGDNYNYDDYNYDDYYNNGDNSGQGGDNSGTDQNGGNSGGDQGGDNSAPNTITCQDDEFSCLYEGEMVCTPNDWKCDEFDDCDDGKDNEGCAGFTYAEDGAKDDPSSKAFPTIAVLSIVAIVIVIVAVGICLYRRRSEKVTQMEDDVSRKGLRSHDAMQTNTGELEITANM